MTLPLTLRACFPPRLRLRHDTDLDAEKRRLRSEAIGARDRLSRVARRQAALLAAEHLEQMLAVLPRGRAVAAFTAFGSEIDTGPMIAKLHRCGMITGLPVVMKRGAPLLFRRFWPFETLMQGAYGISIPAPRCPEIDPELFLVPFAGFDAAGYRIGYGGGFYDRTLAQARARRGRHVLAIGYGYAAQEVPQVPRGLYDLPLDGIITERGMAWFDGRGRRAIRWEKPE